MAEDAAQLEGVEDAYPLTAAQSGMLFHTLSEPGTGIYIGCFDAALPYSLLGRQAIDGFNVFVGQGAIRLKWNQTFKA